MVGRAWRARRPATCGRRECSVRNDGGGLPAWLPLVDREDVLVLDTETTGIGSSAEVIDLAVVDTTGTVRLDTLIMPNDNIPAEASAVHGLTRRMLQRGWRAAVAGRAWATRRRSRWGKCGAHLQCGVRHASTTPNGGATWAGAARIQDSLRDAPICQVSECAGTLWRCEMAQVAGGRGVRRRADGRCTPSIGGRTDYARAGAGSGALAGS